MHRLRIFSVAVLAMLGAVQLAGCASAPGQRATGQVIDDSALTARVKTEIAQDASLGTAANVNVNTYRGVVQLSGFVESEEAKRRAESIATGVQGVQSVKNDLQVNPKR